MRVILLLFLSGFLVQILFQTPFASAHEDNHVHRFMSREAAKLLPEGSAMRREIFEYMDQIEYGSYNEDHHDWVYGHLTGQVYGIVSIPHFWDADEGPEDPVKGIPSAPGIPSILLGPFPNAYQKSIRLFEMAVDKYATDLPMAYTLLGHTAHLLEDMTVPAHVHEDFHPAGSAGIFADVVPGGDDCFEEWIFKSGRYENAEWTAAARADGLITFPPDVEREMRQGNWKRGLYYLMYTTNQYADYFASDDVNGDTFDREGWMDYSGWPDSPTVKSDLEDNDVKLGGVLDSDNDDDGDLSTIASKTYVYGIRAVATLYKMFYELTHPPEASIKILAADKDDDGAADYKWVRLNLTYNVGADEYYRDLEAQYKNEGEDWTEWAKVGAKPKGCIVPWILSHGNGTKKVFCRVRNLVGLTVEVSDSIELKEWGLPQFFQYNVTATGAAYVDVRLGVWLTRVQIKRDCDVPVGYGNIMFVLKPVYVEDESGNHLTDDIRIPTRGWFDVVEPWPKYIDISDTPIFSYVPAIPGEKVRLYTSGIDMGIIETERYVGSLGNVCINYTLVPQPNPLPSSGTVLDLTPSNQWWWWDENGQVNIFYSIKAQIRARYDWEPCSPKYDNFNEGFVEYGAGETIIATSNLEADVGWSTTWQASIDNPAIGFRMEGPDLIAWTKKAEPSMVIVGLSPINLLITDPSGRRTGRLEGWERYGRKFVWRSREYNEIPGASFSRIDLNGDGDSDFVVIFDNKANGDYQIKVSRTKLAKSSDTYSIAVFSKKLTLAPYKPQYQSAFLAKDIPVSDIPAKPYVMRSTAFGGLINLPPSADAGGPYRGSEGTVINFDASCSSDPDSNSLTYRWDFENDGVWDTEWSDSPTASYVWNDDWTGTVKVQVSDGTFTDDATATVVISNAEPVVDAGPDQLAALGDEVQFSGSFTDPGILDTHTIKWDFGDGATATGTLTPTHTYSEAKRYTVILNVTDDDGGVRVDTLTVNTGVEVSIDPPVTSVSPGESVTYDVLIHNLKKVEDTYNLGLNSPRENWYSLSTTFITLNPDQTKSVTLTFSPPSTATIGGYEFTVTATSQTDPATSDIANADSIVFTKIAIIESCDSTGTKKNTFDTSEEIYITGTGFSPSTTYNIYVIEDVTTWVDGMAIPPRVPGTITSISSDNYGNIQVTLLWTSQPVPGKYDIIVDSDGDGIYDADTDALDDNDIEVTAGFDVIPEFNIIAMLMAMIVMLMVYIVVFKRARQPNSLIFLQ